MPKWLYRQIIISSSHLMKRSRSWNQTHKILKPVRVKNRRISHQIQSHNFVVILIQRVSRILTSLNRCPLMRTIAVFTPRHKFSTWIRTRRSNFIHLVKRKRTKMSSQFKRARCLKETIWDNLIVSYQILKNSIWQRLSSNKIMISFNN